MMSALQPTRYSPQVIDYFKAYRGGWQAYMVGGQLDYAQAHSHGTVKGPNIKIQKTGA
jgi:hypothetical protein